MNVPIATNIHLNSLYTEYMLISGDRPIGLTKLYLLAIANLTGLDRVKISVGSRLNTYRYFDQNRFTNFLTGAGSFNSSGSTLFAAIDRGSGAIVSWHISPQFRFNAGYLGENTEFLSSANPNNFQSNPPIFVVNVRMQFNF